MIMAEEKISFLRNIATVLPNSENNAYKLLKSYYLMRGEVTTQSDCKHCCSSFKQGNHDTKVLPIKLTAKQRYRIRKSNETFKRKNCDLSGKQLLESNQLEKTCKVCKRPTIIYMKKPAKPAKDINKVLSNNKTPITSKSNVTNPGKDIRNLNKSSKTKNINVYSNSKEIFSLQNSKNTLASTVKALPKIIKNNKKKKDKFAGLCKSAVLAAAKASEQEKKKNKLDLFLKPM